MVDVDNMATELLEWIAVYAVVISYIMYKFWTWGK